MRQTTFPLRSSWLTLVLLGLFVAPGCGEPEPPYEEGLPDAPFGVIERPTTSSRDAHVGERALPEDVPDEGQDVPSGDGGTNPVEDPPAADEGPPPGDAPADPPPLDQPDPPPADGPVITPPADGCPIVRVVQTGGVTLNVRPGPSTSGGPVGSLAPGQRVTVLGVVEDGQAINGLTRWYEIDDDGGLTGFVSGAFTACVDPSQQPTFDDDVFLLPLTCGSSATVTQGNNTSFSHKNASKYAFDFGLSLNTPLRAMRAGTVVALSRATQPGDPCYSGGGSECIAKANYITIDHGDGSNTIYAHVNSVLPSVGDYVERGETVALSGGTGYSTGPHAHVARQQDCGYSHCQSIPMSFGDVSGDGVPVGGEVVHSQNGCP